MKGRKLQFVRRKSVEAIFTGKTICSTYYTFSLNFSIYCLLRTAMGCRRPTTRGSTLAGLLDQKETYHRNTVPYSFSGFYTHFNGRNQCFPERTWHHAYKPWPLHTPTANPAFLIPYSCFFFFFFFFLGGGGETWESRFKISGKEWIF